MTLPRKIAFNTVFSSVAKVLWTLIALVTVGLITRYLGAAGFGEYTTILSFYFMLAALGDLGLNQIVLREISSSEKNEKRIVSVAFTLRIISSILLVLLALAITPFLPYSKDVRWGIVLASSGLVFSSGYQILTGIFQKRLAAYWVALGEMTGRVVNLGWVAACAYFNWGTVAVVGGTILSWFSTFMIVFFLARRLVPFRFFFDKKEAKRLLTEALPLGISAIITFIYFRVDTIILSIIKGPEDVGIYGAAYKILENLSYFPSMFMGLIMPLYARHILTDRAKFKRIADKTFGAISVVAVGLLFAIFALAPKIINVIAGSGFDASVVVLKMLSFGIFGIFFAQYFNMILIAANFQKKLLKIFALCAVINVALNLLLIPRFSYIAAGAVSAATECLVPVLAAAVAYKSYGYFPKLRPFVRVLPAGVVMFAVLVFIKAWPIYVQIPIGGSVYVFLVFALKAVSYSDFKKIISPD